MRPIENRPGGGPQVSRPSDLVSRPAQQRPRSARHPTFGQEISYTALRKYARFDPGTGNNPVDPSTRRLGCPRQHRPRLRRLHFACHCLRPAFQAQHHRRRRPRRPFPRWCTRQGPRLPQQQEPISSFTFSSNPKYLPLTRRWRACPTDLQTPACQAQPHRYSIFSLHLRNQAKIPSVCATSFFGASMPR